MVFCLILEHFLLQKLRDLSTGQSLNHVLHCQITIFGRDINFKLQEHIHAGLLLVNSQKDHFKGSLRMQCHSAHPSTKVCPSCDINYIQFLFTLQIIQKFHKNLDILGAIFYESLWTFCVLSFPEIYFWTWKLWITI